MMPAAAATVGVMSLLNRDPEDHQYWMGEALREAATGAERGEVPVGCVIVHAAEAGGAGRRAALASRAERAYTCFWRKPATFSSRTAGSMGFSMNSSAGRKSSSPSK
jgi:hypothetical protein